MMRSQQGYLMLVAVLLIMVIGFLGVSVAYMISSSAFSTNQFTQAETAFDIAASGLEKSTRFLQTPFLTGTNPRTACSAITGESNLTDSSVGSGTFTATTVSGSPFYANTTLNGALTASATSLTLTSTTGFAPSGRVSIDREAISYSSISGSSLVGLKRGIDNTIASTHASGTYVSQFQCSLDSIGYIPNSSATLWKNEQQQGIQLQEGWAVGDRSGNSFILTHWNYPTALSWTNASISNPSNRVNLNAISLLSNADGWATGDTSGTNFIFLHLLGSTWNVSVVAGACSGQNINGISAVSATQAWAVGVRTRATTCSSGNYRYTILYWNGASWVELTPSTSPSIPADGTSSAIQNLNAVHVINTTGTGAGTIGFAVGQSGTILKYNGSNWVTDTSSVTNNLFGVYVVSMSEAWAVGASGRILKWNGSTWSTVTSPTTTQLNGITMLDTDGSGTANYGWAVGNSGVAIVYNGSSWSSQNIGGSTTWWSVAIPQLNDAWAAGNGGNIRHWDGSAWNTVSSDESAALNAIAFVSPQSKPWSGWHEIFP
ncbi:MAG: hypothetical protein SFW66_10530 [Gammaproteobacteria bacterium]|nr:hypothetical protein [Gammaproteobacteria bacterium]